MKVNSDRSITVKYTVKKKIPAAVNISLDWKYPASTRNNASHSRKQITGAVGARTAKLTGVPASIMAVRVQFTLARPTEVKSYLRLNAPAKKTQHVKVTAARAAANAVAQHIPGFVLTFAPQGKAVKAVSGLVWGWSVVKAVVDSRSGVTTGCPAMRNGQHLRTITWFSASGATVRLNAHYTVWNTEADYQKGRKPACDKTFVVTQFS